MKMENLSKKESFLHAIIKEFLESQDFTETLEAYNEELYSKSIEPDSESLPSPLDEKSVKVKDDFLRMFHLGNQKEFWVLWQKHVTRGCQEKNETQRLEFKLQLYFAVFPLLEDEMRLSPVEASMSEFKKYLETNGASLSQTTEFVAFYALPYVPNPKNHPTFKTLFQTEWRDELMNSLTLFLDGILHSEPLPYLYKLHIGALTPVNEKDEEDNEKLVTDLKEELKQNESRANTYFDKFARLQGDYHNLIGIAAELVDSLEQCVRGKMITPEYLQDICQRLFGEAMKKEQSVVDLTVPGTASSMLRASVSMDVELSASKSIATNLNFNVIQKDLAGPASPRTKALLLQALIWQLTKTTGVKREAAISTYISHDLLGCSNGNLPKYVTKICALNDDIAVEYFARLVNGFASFTAGRVYMSQSDALILKMIEVMIKSDTGSFISENLLGALQKLSLRRHAQTLLIENDSIKWLFGVIDDPDNLSDYALEYTVALLMNLCLRTSGKKKCCADAERILKSLSDLLGFDNIEIRPYINGTIYSLLSLPSMRHTALSMGLEDILKCYLEDKTQDERQIRFIIKQLNSADPLSDDDVQSDDEDEDDDDEEGDAIETEVQKLESITASNDEQNGEELLKSRYTNATFTSSKQTANHKKKSHLQSLDENGPLRRPITPATRPHNSMSSFSADHVAPVKQPIYQPVVQVQIERPRTSSSKSSSRRPPPEQEIPGDDAARKLNVSNKKGGKTFKQGFTSRPKIPRTPEVNSRPNSGTEIPPLTRSISPSRPDSGRASKPGSRGSQQRNSPR